MYKYLRVSIYNIYKWKHQEVVEINIYNCWVIHSNIHWGRLLAAVFWLIYRLFTGYLQSYLQGYFQGYLQGLFTGYLQGWPSSPSRWLLVVECLVPLQGLEDVLGEGGHVQAPPLGHVHGDELPHPGHQLLGEAERGGDDEHDHHSAQPPPQQGRATQTQAVSGAGPVRTEGG